MDEVRVLLIPGGGRSVDGAVPALEDCLGEERARLIAVDPAGLDRASGRVWLRLADHAAWAAEAARRDGDGPVLVVGHSLGGLVALRLALDAPRLVSSLLLLDPSPLLPAVLLPAPALNVAAWFRRRAGSRSSPRAVSPFVRVMWHFVLDAGPLAADLAVRRLTGTPTTIVSAGEHARDSVMRRTHERLATWIPGASVEVWAGTTHSLDGEEPRIAAAVHALASTHD